MDPAKVLEITRDLFLVSGILSEDIGDDMKEKIKEGEYERLAKFLIYMLILEMNESPIYNNIRKEMIRPCLVTAMIIDIYGFRDSLAIEQFTKLIYKFFKYLVENKLDIGLDKEKWELLNTKLKELYILIQK